MGNLIIGHNSQISHYLPQNFIRISSRKIDFDSIKKEKYQNIFLNFAEQRTFLNENEKFFTDVNVDYTLKVIKSLVDYSDNIVVFSTSELWNLYEGPINLDDSFKYNYTPYIKSKEILVEKIKSDDEVNRKVKVVYPFNFNTPYRREGFLFGKIFNSIIEQKPIEIGNINFLRDIIHPEIISKNILDLKSDIIIGCGELINIELFVRDLYKKFDMEFEEFVKITKNYIDFNTRNNYFCGEKFSSIKEIFKLTTNDIQKCKISRGHNK